MRITIMHRSYGCDTGCCGHVIEVDGKTVRSFIWDHPRSREDFKAWATELIE